MTCLFFLAFEEEGFGLWGGGKGVATGDEGWAGCLASVTTAPDVAPDGDPTVFNDDDRGDLARRVRSTQEFLK